MGIPNNMEISIGTDWNFTDNLGERVSPAKTKI